MPSSPLELFVFAVGGAGEDLRGFGAYRLLPRVGRVLYGNGLAFRLPHPEATHSGAQVGVPPVSRTP